jgi:hypothetical protein
MSKILPSIARIIGTIAATFLSSYLGLWFCCRILKDLGKGPSDSSFLICFLINALILTAFAMIIRARWWEAIAPLPVPIATASIISIMAGQDHYANMILFAFGIPVIISAAAVHLLRGPFRPHPIA